MLRLSCLYLQINCLVSIVKSTSLRTFCFFIFNLSIHRLSCGFLKLKNQINFQSLKLYRSFASFFQNFITFSSFVRIVYSYYKGKLRCFQFNTSEKNRLKESVLHNFVQYSIIGTSFCSNLFYFVILVFKIKQFFKIVTKVYMSEIGN